MNATKQKPFINRLLIFIHYYRQIARQAPRVQSGKPTFEPAREIETFDFPMGGPEPAFYLAVGVVLVLAAFFVDFFFLLDFLAVFDLAAGVAAAVVAAKAEPDTTPKNKTDKITANAFFITTPFSK
jgi:hypothetical protein